MAGKNDSDHYTEEGTGYVQAGPNEIEEARKRHHLATADPEPERDGTMTGPAHEEKYGLERAEASAELWRGIGVHPTENRALRPGEAGFENTVEGAAEDTSASAPSNQATPAKGENA